MVKVQTVKTHKLKLYWSVRSINEAMSSRNLSVFSSKTLPVSRKIHTTRKSEFLPTTIC